jgi:hypothetical protein
MGKGLMAYTNHNLHQERRITMKRTFAIMIALAFCLAFVPVASADLQSNATAHVWVDVAANVAVTTIDSQVNLGSVQLGSFDANILFRVDANMENVDLWVYATKLYKGDDPTNSDVKPIEVNNTGGVVIAPKNANATKGGSNVAAYNGDIELDGFSGYSFAPINFESSQNGHFSQDVNVTVSYIQDDPEKPMGEYSGKVRLYCMLTPPT